MPALARAEWGSLGHLEQPGGSMALVAVCAKQKICLRCKAFGRLRREVCSRFKASLGCTVKSTIKCQKASGTGALDLALEENLGEITVWCAVSQCGRDAEP